MGYLQNGDGVPTLESLVVYVMGRRGGGGRTKMKERVRNLYNETGHRSKLCVLCDCNAGLLLLKDTMARKLLFLLPYTWIIGEILVLIQCWRVVL